VLLHENPSLTQLNANQHADNEPSAEQDQIHACHCMSLPTVSQNTQYFLHAGCGLACAMASAEMALFAAALSVWFDHLEVLPLRLDHSEESSLWFDGFIIRRRRLCGSIIRRSCLCGLFLRRHCLCRRTVFCGYAIFAEVPSLWRCRLF
jgi:hypothetical protein